MVIQFLSLFDILNAFYDKKKGQLENFKRVSLSHPH